MKLTNRAGMLVLAVFLILYAVGIIASEHLPLRVYSFVLAGVAILAGCLIAVDR